MSFMYFFLTLERDCGIDLNVYLKEQLKGVLVDFSTAQATGFVECVTELLGEEAESTAMNLLKGCYVHWMRSCNRIARIVCRPDRRTAFLTLCGSIRTEPDQEQVLLMFNTIAELYKETVPWVQWWTRDQNLRLLSRAFNNGDGWDQIPNDTNIVESLNHVLDKVMSKNVAIQFSGEFDLDERAFLQWKNGSSGIDLSYRNNSLPSRLESNRKRRESRYSQLLDYRAPDCSRMGIGKGRENMSALQKFRMSIIHSESSSSLSPCETVIECSDQDSCSSDDD